MGSFFEINDTLQITKEQGFPVSILDLKKHRKNPIKLENVSRKVFEFHDKPGARLYHSPPTRCFLVQNIGGKWVYWGKILVLEQTIRTEDKRTTTSGKYRITEIYEPQYQEQITRHETPKGKGFF